MSLARAKIGGRDSRDKDQPGTGEEARGKGNSQGISSSVSESREEGPTKENPAYSYDVRWRVMRECLEALAYIHSKVQT